MEVATSLFFTWLMWYIFTTYRQRRQMPPGPFPLPLIGNIFQVGRDVVSSFDKLWTKYGDVYTISFPFGTAVVVNSVELAREALVTKGDDFAGRPSDSMYPADIIFEGRDIFSVDYGPAFLFRRKAFRSALHLFGAGLEQAEGRMDHAVEDLLQEIERMEGRPFSPIKYISSAVVSEMWSWLTSKKCSFSHPTVNSLLEFNEKATVLGAQGSLYQVIPWLKYLPTNFKKNLNDLSNIKKKIFVPELQAHLESYKPGIIRDVIDGFLSEYMKDMGKGTAEDVGSIEDVTLLMLDVMGPGTETSSSILAWFILYMLLNQNVQDKIHAELDIVVGRDRLPRWQDAPNLPYLQATLCEVIRHSSFIPIFPPHGAIRDTTIDGYSIPKGTSVFFNIHRLHQDLKQWPESKSFKPERFLDEDGTFVGWSKLPSFFPFGYGRRACPGEALGKMQLFKLASGLMHRFKFEKAPEEAKPTLEHSGFAFVICPKDYKVAAIKRIVSSRKNLLNGSV